jgi:hypothetical protein
MEKISDFSSIDPYKTKMMPEGESPENYHHIKCLGPLVLLAPQIFAQ